MSASCKQRVQFDRLVAAQQVAEEAILETRRAFDQQHADLLLADADRTHQRRMARGQVARRRLDVDRVAELARLRGPMRQHDFLGPAVGGDGHLDPADRFALVLGAAARTAFRGGARWTPFSRRNPRPST